MINYTEFIAASLSVQNTLTEEQMWTMFKKFDVDDTNYITFENLKIAFARGGQEHITDEKLMEIMKKHDIDNSGNLSFEEFKLVFNQAA